MNKYIVWNYNRTVGFATNDKQLSYETRKQAVDNLYDKEGDYSHSAKEFCDRHGDDGDFILQEIENT